MFCQAADVEGEEDFPRQAEFVECVAERHVVAGKACCLTVEVGVVGAAGVGAGEGIPEAVELLLRHVEKPLHILHAGVDVAEHVEVADVEHGVAVAEAVEVDPIVLFAGEDEVAHLEVAVEAGGGVGDALCEGFEAVQGFAVYELHFVQGLKQMRFAAGEETGVAGGGEEFLAAGAEQGGHLLGAPGGVAADASERLFGFD